MADPNNTAPLMTEDLTGCAGCGAPATGWRPGPGGRAVGCCGYTACAAEIAKRAAAAPAPRVCRFCSGPGVHNMGNFVICGSKECAVRISVLKMVIIYDRPLDSPGGFFVREWIISRGMVIPGGVLGRDLPDLEASRALVPPGLVNIGRVPEDDRRIVEAWLGVRPA